MRRKLGEFAADPMFSREIDRAQQMYLMGLENDFLDENEDIIMERCFEWFIFDYVTGGGLTPIEVFAARKKVSDMEKRLLDHWTGSRLSLFEVCGINSGDGLEIVDLFHNSKITVSNYNVSGNLEKGTIIYMRVLKVGGEYEFSTGGLGLPPACCGLLMEKIGKDMGRYTSRKGRDKFLLDNYLKERSHKINSWAMDFAYRFYFLDEDLDRVQQPDITALSGKLSSRIAQQITDAFLDDYYDRWINQPVQALDGRTPRESCKTVHGRAKVEELLKELEKVEKKRVKRGEPHYDIGKVRAMLGLVRGESAGRSQSRKTVPSGIKSFEEYSWTKKVHADVALIITDHLKTKGYSPEQAGGAVKLWFDYCARENPNVRKGELWAAAVVYAMARLEFNGGLQQRMLADEFGVSLSGLSEKYRSLCRTLDLVVFDRRYASGKSPIEGLEISDPLLARILYNLKL
ncbi:MAG: MbcA/ParS/Xre antitoxin family protein [Firmicutes bacterium]|nr:MbcA/ParS/Xre antitoxin family protein [Bacillota bacterium]